MICPPLVLAELLNDNNDNIKSNQSWEPRTKTHCQVKSIDRAPKQAPFANLDL